MTNFKTLATTAPRNGHHPEASQRVDSIATPVERDEFDSREFEDGRESLPYLQMLNHQQPDQAGFFITAENASTVNFMPNDEWSLHTTTFQSGETVEGYRALLARLLILRKSRLMMFDRESGDFIGLYQKSRYDRNTMVLKTRYLVFLVGKNKQLLHDAPLLLTAKGSFNGSFGEVVRKFQADLSKAYGAATGARKPRGDRFMALSVLAVRVQPELKGKERKSWACSVVDYGVPTAENWRSYFVGYQPQLKEKILAAFEEWSEFGTWEREVEVQEQRWSSPPATVSDPTEDGTDESFEAFDYGGYPDEL